jgi:hypothetical protein
MARLGVVTDEPKDLLFYTTTMDSQSHNWGFFTSNAKHRAACIVGVIRSIIEAVEDKDFVVIASSDHGG